MNWWERDQVVEQQPPASATPWESDPEAPPSYSGGVLPFSRDSRGNVRFDTDAGLIGAVKRAITLPGDVRAGRVDPMSDEGIGRAFELGTIATPVNPGLRMGDAAIPGFAHALRRHEPAPPSAQELRDAARLQYGAVREMGVDYSTPVVTNMMRTVQTGLENDGILRELAPKTFSVLQRFVDPPTDSVVSVSGLDAARRALGHAAKDFANPTEQLAAQRAISSIDDFIAKADPSSVVAGPAADAAAIISAARGNYAARQRSERLSGVGESAELRAGATNSGQNLDNAIRSRVASILDSARKRAGFTQDEIAFLNTVARGTYGRNAARFVGNLLGGGGGLGSVVTASAGSAAGGLMAGPLGGVAGAALPALGFGMKQIGNALTQRALRQADEMTRRRSPLHDEALANAPLGPASIAARSSAVRSPLLALPQEQDYDPSMQILLRAVGRD